MTDTCSCRPEGFPFHCSRHQCEKNFHWHSVCQSHPDWDPKNFVQMEVVEEHFEYPDAPPITAAPRLSNPSPTLFQQAWNLASSLTDFVADGCETVSSEQYAQRLEICQTCPDRRENHCNVCGCYLKLKAQGRAFTCPVGKWPAVDEPVSANS